MRGVRILPLKTTGTKTNAPVLVCATLVCALLACARPASPEDEQVFAFGSCAKQNEPQPIWDTILKAKPELMLLLGDNVYADGTDMNRKRRAYKKLAAIPGFARLRAAVPLLAVWDDHDYGANDLGGGYPAKAASEKIFLDFFEVPSDSARRRRPGIYFAHEVGPENRRVQFLMLDTRYFRDTLEPAAKSHPRKRVYLSTTDKNKTLLGAEQWRWLEAQLRRPARLRVIVSSIQVLPVDHTGERWDAFPHERDRLFQLLRDTDARGVLFLSGDRHYGEIMKVEGAAAFPLYEFTSSGLNSVWEYGAREPNRYRLGRTHPVFNFGLLRVNWRTETVSGEIRDVRGQLREGRTISFEDLGVR